MAEPPCSGQGSEAILKTENAAVEMYRFAALMLGNEAEALSLVENTVATVDVDPCADPCAAKGLVRERVLDGALEIMHRQDPASFADLPAAESGSCLEDDDAALSGTEITELASGAGRGPLRDWLNRLVPGAAGSFCAARGSGQQQCGHGASDQPLREAIHLDSGSGQQPVPASALLAGFFAGPLCAGDPGLAAASRVRPADFFLRNVLARLDVTFALKSARRNPRASTTLIAGFF